MPRFLKRVRTDGVRELAVADPAGRDRARPAGS
ncbi:hypothetical protein QFZ49_006619 [Streptomyces turgidiscabies]|uniref:Uncharacterized protein n=1 Tax=Streptomyces turgidiscabies TaxID=85558 RepID=A0ABU0RXE2_9ACTN|nr:hypothetical protein [Streptomyces turgidiscabies]